jgi:hypothetical protein
MGLVYVLVYQRVVLQPMYPVDSNISEDEEAARIEGLATDDDNQVEKETYMTMDAMSQVQPYSLTSLYIIE